MQIIEHITDRLDVAVTDGGEVALVTYGSGERAVARVPDIEELFRAIRKADLIATEHPRRA